MEAEAPGRPSVRFDAEGGAAAAFEHLVELGHRRIGHLAATFDAPTFHLREAARRTVLAEAGLDPDTQPRALTADHASTTPATPPARCSTSGPRPSSATTT